MTEAAAVYPPLDQRPLKNTICLFDVDETLTPARRVRPLPQPSSLYFLFPSPDQSQSPGRFPPNAPNPLPPPPQMRHRLRRRLRLRQAARTARHPRSARDCALRLLLRRKWPHGLPHGGAVGEPELCGLVG